MKVGPRIVPSRDDYYMGMAFWISRKSKDPHTQMGTYIVNQENKCMGIGYNGPPRCVDDNSINWDRPSKYNWVVHSEENAIINSCYDLNYCTLYVTGKPCKSCMLKIANAGITRVVYFPFKSKDSKSMFGDENAMDETDEIAKLTRVKLEVFSGNLNWMRDDLEKMINLGIFG